MAKAIEVARYLIGLAAREEEPDYLSNLRLQKLLYYVQGWSLAQRDRPMFNDRFEAWIHGPVVPHVYRAFKGYDEQPIPPEAIEEPKNLSREECEFITDVWSVFRDYSASKLRAMTHEEAPWKDARGDCNPTGPCNREITKAAMRRWFQKVEDQREAALARNACDDPGEDIPWEDVRAEIRAR